MTQQDAIIFFLLIVIGVLFVNELRRQRQERNAATLYNKEKADAIMKTLDLQGDVIMSLDGRINSLGDVVEALVKIQQAQYEKDPAGVIPAGKGNNRKPD